MLARSPRLRRLRTSHGVTSEPTASLARLRELLHGNAPSADLVGELRRARCDVAQDPALAGEVADAELRWLLRRGARIGWPSQELADARCALAALRARNAAAAPVAEVDALFELAEACAALESEGRVDVAREFAAERDLRARAIADAEIVAREADERWAAHQASEFGTDAAADACLLRSQGAMLRAIALRLDDRRLRRRAARAMRAADDLQLQSRLARVLTPRGASLLETTSFLLLFVVLGSLAAQAAPGVPESVLHWTNALDAVAGCWFVAEFALKWTLAPRRGSWFLRNALTDLLPAIPAVLFLLPAPAVPGGASDALALRVLRFFRVTQAARTVQMLRPLLRLVRLVLLLVRGMDGAVRKFRPLLDRTFVFLGAPEIARLDVDPRRELVHAALRREQIELESMPADAGVLALKRAVAEAIQRANAQVGAWSGAMPMPPVREIAVDDACEFLWALRPDDVSRLLRPSEVRAIDRIVRVSSAPPFGWLPLLSSFRVDRGWQTAEERVAALGRRIADWLMRWQDRLQFYADLHGIVTGPQILDRVATAMVKASQRPAVRLLLFGGLFSVLSVFWEENCLSKVVGLPLLLLGSVCSVFLVTGWWLKRIAGEASETFRLTSEAHFVALLGLQKQRHERQDVEFLAQRTIADVADEGCADLLASQLEGARAGVPVDVRNFDARQEQLASRVALLYLHFLGGALLHESDVKTTQQLLANLSLENLRLSHLGHTRKDKKRLRALRLDEGTLFRGPYMWFRFITESVAVETSKRILDYNRRCVPLEQRRALSQESERELADWLRSRMDPKKGRTIVRQPTRGGGGFATTEFHALHFLTREPERDAHVEAVFGSDVLAALRADRRNMVRAIFGMRPADEGNGASRTFNPWRRYWSRWSHGRALLAPLLLPLRLLRSIAWAIARVRRIVREVTNPELEMQRIVPPVATFAVALRKIHRMKAPGLLEAIRLRIAVDPSYCGAPASFGGAVLDGAAPLERDLDFLRVHERERATFLAAAERNRERVLRLQAALRRMPSLGDATDAAARADGELAVTIAWITDRDRVRTLVEAAAWLATELPAILREGACASSLGIVASRCRGLVRAHKAERLLRQRKIAADAVTSSRLRLAYEQDARVRRTVDALVDIGDADPEQVAITRLRDAWKSGPEVRRELVTLRAVQSLAALDVRNYRQLVYELGDYAADGESPESACALP